jgi:hypothetical protein
MIFELKLLLSRFYSAMTSGTNLALMNCAVWNITATWSYLEWQSISLIKHNYAVPPPRHSHEVTYWNICIWLGGGVVTWPPDIACPGSIKRRGLRSRGATIAWRHPGCTPVRCWIQPCCMKTVNAWNENCQKATRNGRVCPRHCASELIATSVKLRNESQERRRGIWWTEKKREKEKRG